MNLVKSLFFLFFTFWTGILESFVKVPLKMALSGIKVTEKLPILGSIISLIVDRLALTSFINWF
jgi:hypothetical protein